MYIKDQKKKKKNRQIRGVEGFSCISTHILLQKGMATHSSILAWRIPRRVEPGRLPSMQSQRLGHN